MDGLALASACTLGASAERPVVLRVEEIVAAGDSHVRRFRDNADLAVQGYGANVVKDVRIRLSMNGDPLEVDSTSDCGASTTPAVEISPCVEVMTGARFSQTFVGGRKEWMFDACVRLEDAVPVPSLNSKGARLVQLVKPVPPEPTPTCCWR